tara:strand:+ start:376 stop:483 length:108 start_codon:yes stop_codon:yes gene_type:complete
MEPKWRKQKYGNNRDSSKNFSNFGEKMEKMKNNEK